MHCNKIYFIFHSGFVEKVGYVFGIKIQKENESKCDNRFLIGNNVRRQWRNIFKATDRLLTCTPSTENTILKGKKKEYSKYTKAKVINDY